MVVQATHSAPELIEKKTIQRDSGEWLLAYYMQSTNSSSGEELFAMAIEKSTPDGVLVEREETPAVSNSREAILTMAMAFAKGDVEPDVLHEMVDEWEDDLLVPAA